MILDLSDLKAKFAFPRFDPSHQGSSTCEGVPVPGGASGAWRTLRGGVSLSVDEAPPRYTRLRLRATSPSPVCDVPQLRLRGGENTAGQGLQGLRPLNLEIRAGVHAGEVELTADAVRGIAVHNGARVAALAGGSEILVSSTVRGPRRRLWPRVRRRRRA